MSMRSNLAATAVIGGVMAVISGAAGAATTTSPFCTAGSPTPKYVCDAIKAAAKKKPAAQKVRHDTAKSAISNIR